MENPGLYSVAGALVGWLVGLTGVGGGSLMTPALIFLFHFNPTVAVGTDLIFAALTKLFGVWLHGQRGAVDWQLVRWLGLGSLPAAALTLLALGGGHPAELALVVTKALGITLILTALAVLLRHYLLALGRRRADPDSAHSVALRPWLTVVTGVMLGVLVTLTSVGAGALCAVILLFLYPWRLTPARLVGTDLAHAVPLTLVAGSGHLLLGNVNFAVLGYLLLGSLPGIYCGSWLSARISAGLLRTALACVLLLVGLKVLLS